MLSPVSELLCVFLHALVLCELHELAGSSAHVDGRGSRGRQVAQRVPDEGHEVIAPGARPQLHRQAQAPHDGDGGSAAHLQGERSHAAESEPQDHQHFPLRASLSGASFHAHATLTNQPFKLIQHFYSALKSAHWNEKLDFFWQKAPEMYSYGLERHELWF